jgi:hypothetical protein
VRGFDERTKKRRRKERGDKNWKLETGNWKLETGN